MRFPSLISQQSARRFRLAIRKISKVFLVFAAFSTGCSIHVTGDIHGARYSFDVAIENFEAELPALEVPAEPREQEVMY